MNNKEDTTPIGVEKLAEIFAKSLRLSNENGPAFLNVKAETARTTNSILQEIFRAKDVRDALAGQDGAFEAQNVAVIALTMGIFLDELHLYRWDDGVNDEIYSAVKSAIVKILTMRTGDRYAKDLIDMCFNRFGVALPLEIQKNSNKNKTFSYLEKEPTKKNEQKEKNLPKKPQLPQSEEKKDKTLSVIKKRRDQVAHVVPEVRIAKSSSTPKDIDGNWCWENFEKIATSLGYNTETKRFLKSLIEGAPTLLDEGTNLSAKVQNWAGIDEEKALNKMIEMGVLEEITPSKGLTAGLGAVPKGVDDIRPILDCRELNAKSVLWATEVNTLKYFPLIPEWAAVIDIESGYTHIPLSEEWASLTQVKVNGKTYGAKRLPFGSSVAAQMFTMVLQVVVERVRADGFFVLQYVDDLLIGGRTKEETEKALDHTKKLLNGVGFKVKSSKTQKPDQEVKYLGFDLDLKSRRISLPRDKREKMLDMTKDVMTLSEIASLQGKLQSASIVHQKYRRLSLEISNFVKHQMFRFGASSMEDFVRLHNSTKLTMPLHLREEISAWLKLEIRGDLSPRVVTATVATDASLNGIGIALETKEEKRMRKRKPKKELPKQIDLLELSALEEAIEFFPEKALNGCWVWLVDNQVALSAFRRARSVKDSLRNMSNRIWRRMEELNLKVIPMWIPTDRNKVADMLSRDKPVRIKDNTLFGDLTLCPTSFEIPDYTNETFSMVRECPRIKNRTGKSLQDKSRKIRTVARRHKMAFGKYPEVITRKMLETSHLSTPMESSISLDEKEAKAAWGYESILFYAEVESYKGGWAYKETSENMVLDLMLRAMSFGKEIDIYGARLNTWLPWRYYVAETKGDKPTLRIDGLDLSHRLSSKGNEELQEVETVLSGLADPFTLELLKDGVAVGTWNQYRSIYNKYLQYYGKLYEAVPAEVNKQAETVLHKFINECGNELRADGSYKVGVARLQSMYSAVQYFWGALGWAPDPAFERHKKAMSHRHEQRRKGLEPIIRDQRGISKSQVWDLAEYIKETEGEDVRDTALALYFTCSRRSDLELGNSAVVVQDGNVQVSIYAKKNDTSKTIPINEQELNEHPQGKEFFQNLVRNKVKILKARKQEKTELMKTLNTRIRAWTKERNLPRDILLHSFRRGRAKELKDKHTDMEVVRAAGGWNSPGLAEHYADCAIVNDYERFSGHSVSESSDDENNQTSVRI
eukprot:TRINITY_DN3258_c2_g2_i2.p1 TRINITY_DN3258_c2_g2~~TRINITY_DN3258_c2_g2_i2.p1  ORF type:complete len:1209 (-),score=65.86 TRINITY_DN3258_c2_g2_i2:432-4058(-)